MSRILIIEDDKSIAELERDYLELNGFEVTICEDGEKGLEEALGGSFDLILLDLMLPGRTDSTSAAGCGKSTIRPSSSSVPSTRTSTRSAASDSGPTIT